MALSVNEIEALTQDYWEPGAHDQFFTDNVLCYRLLKKGKKYAGGKKLRVQVAYGQPQGGTFNAASTFKTAKVEEHTAAFWTQASYYEYTTYDFDDMTMNAGEAQQIDLVMTKLDSLADKIKWNMGTDIYTSASAGPNGRSIAGLAWMINTNTYGEIAPADLAEWTAGSIVTTATPITFGIIRTLRTACKVGLTREKPGLLITTDTLLDYLKSLLQPSMRYENEDMADVGFVNIGFEAAGLIVADGKCPSGYFYALNEDYLDFKSHNDFFFKREPWKEPYDKPFFTTRVIWVGQLLCKRRNAHGYHSGLTT